jgi:hypothetical protein
MSPYFAAAARCPGPDAVNLGFVVNVIEDPLNVLRRFASICYCQAVSSGCKPLWPRDCGKPYFRDGFLTSIFKSISSQPEFKRLP